MLRPSDVSAIIVTRGDVDLASIIATLPYREVVVWDNRVRPGDARTFGRYLAIREAVSEYVYFQDDDCIVRCHDQLLAAYREGCIVANMKPERIEEYLGLESALLGWGSVMHRDQPWAAIECYLSVYPNDEFFREIAVDHVVPLFSPCILVAGGVEDLPYALDEGRTSCVPGWQAQKREAIRRGDELRRMA